MCRIRPVNLVNPAILSTFSLALRRVKALFFLNPPVFSSRDHHKTASIHCCLKASKWVRRCRTGWSLL